MRIPFNKPSFTGHELDYICRAVLSGKISGDGIYTDRCQKLLEEKFNAKKVYLTTSCTDALELSALLLDLKHGDEVIAPSYTFTSTVNSFMLRGAKPVFIDIRADTKNIDERLIETKITSRTRAVFLTHYAGVACEMDKIRAITKRRGIYLVEDAAQAVNAKYKGRYLGTIGDLGCYSFHETKNFMCGEGGAIVVNNEKFLERVEILREKGTDRSRQARGEIDKYTWRDVGSSFLPSDVLAAFLFAQLENMDKINATRESIYRRYEYGLRRLKEAGHVELPFSPGTCAPNYHLYYLLTKDEASRDSLIKHLRARGICSIFHYLPLHSSPMGQKMGYRPGDLPVTEDVSRRLLRLPFYNELSNEEQDSVIAGVCEFYEARHARRHRPNRRGSRALS